MIKERLISIRSLVEPGFSLQPEFTRELLAYYDQTKHAIPFLLTRVGRLKKALRECAAQKSDLPCFVAARETLVQDDAWETGK